MLRLLHQMRVDLPLAGSVLASTRSIDVRAFEPGADDVLLLAATVAVDQLCHDVK